MKKRFLIFIIAIVAVVIIAFIAALFFSAHTETVETPLSQTASSQETFSLPKTLIIPKLNINTPIESVGITASGDMAVPEKSADVGWYKFGTLPGQVGSAVIAGHLDDFLGLPAIFSKLSTLSVDDDVYVLLENGTTLHFKVTGAKTYPYTGDTKEVFESSEGTHLNLITCNGSWLKDARNYDKRLVVFTELVP